METSRRFLIEQGELLVKARALKAAHNAVMAEVAAFCRRHGATGAVFDIVDDDRAKMIGLPVVSPVPLGWRINERDYDSAVLEPDAAALRAEMEALPRLPRVSAEISAAIGWNGALGDTELHPARLYWAGNNFCIAIPLHDRDWRRTEETVRHGMAFPAPPGCREIGERDWEAIRRQEEVAQERWRSRDTAPKDGTPVMLWIPDARGTPDPLGINPPFLVAIRRWSDEDGQWVDDTGVPDDLPTHWQPLPPRPEERAA